MNEQPTQPQNQPQEQQPEPVESVAQASPPQPEVPLQTTEPAKPKSKKKLIIILVLLLVLGTGAGAWFYFNKDSETPQQTNNAESTETTEVVSIKPDAFIQNGNKVQYIDENDEVQDFAELEDKSLVTEVLMQDGQPRVMYLNYEEIENGFREATSYNESTKDGKKKLFDLPDMTDASWSTPILSPDGKSLVVEVSNIDGFMNNLTKIDVATGDTEVIYEPEEENGTGIVIGWFDNSTILMQEQSCRQCDGPRTAELSKISLDTKTKSPFYKLEDQNVSYAVFKWSPDGKRLFMFGGDQGDMFETNPESETLSYLYEINLEDGSSVEIGEFTQTSVVFQGLSTNGDEAYLSVRSWEKTDESDAEYQSTEGNYNLSVPAILTVKTAGGTPSSFTLGSERNVFAESVIDSKDSLIIQTYKPKDTTYSEYVYQVLSVSKDDENTTKLLLDETFAINTKIVKIFSVKE
jgi:flagellar basal body-associated protein FliL